MPAGSYKFVGTVPTPDDAYEYDRLYAENARLRKAVEILLADKLPPEATFNNVDDMLKWLEE